MAAQPPMIGRDGVERCLTLCGFTPEQQTVWIGEGMETMGDMIIFRASDIPSIGQSLQRLSRAPRQPWLKLVKLSGVVQWCSERRAQGLSLDARALDENILQSVIDRMHMRKDERDADDDGVPAPKAFEPRKWVSWKLSFENYLSQQTSNQHVPLSYVLRSQTPPTDLLQLNEEQQRFWQTTLVGVRFMRDSQQVWKFLKFGNF